MIKKPKPQGYYTDKVFTPAEMDAAVLAEREACAMTAENTSVYDRYSPEDTIADAIRARGQA
jgi:hypothetical protein